MSGLSKHVAANHSEEMKKCGEKEEKSMTRFSKFDNKRDGEKSRAEEKLPLNSFLSPRFLFLGAADRCHLKSQRYFLIVKGRAGR